MRRGLVRSSRYSPGNMDVESLEQLFVGRDHLMDDVLKEVLSSVGSRNQKHHVLLVGPRGSGKTHFVVLAYHRLLQLLKTRHLDQQIVIAFLNEEEWGVASYLDFLVRILRALVTDANDLNQSINTVYDRFATDPEAAITLAETILRDHVGSRTLLLICENLVDLFSGLDADGQGRWRAFIQQTGFWTTLATTPALFAAVTHPQHPFHGFFALRVLKKLEYPDAHRLLVKKAVHDNKTDLADFLQTPSGRARIRAVHHLASGNHRAYVVLYDFLNRQSLDDLIKPFMQMVDDLTPYYQDKMRQLPPAQRKIVEFLCQSVRPVPVKEIAMGCLMTQQTAAKQLGELMAAGFIHKSPIGRQSFCELSEPLLRICIEVKDNRTEHFSLFVEFLRHWFSSRELELRVKDLDSKRETGIDAVHLREALRCSRPDSGGPFVEALEKEAVQCLKERDYSGCAGIYRNLIQERSQPSDYYWLTRALNGGRWLEEAVRTGTEAIEKFPNDPHLHFNLAQSLFGRRRYSDALEQVDLSIAIGPPICAYHCFRSDTLSELKRYDEAIEAAKAAFAVDPAHWHSHDQILDALIESRRLHEAESHAEELVSQFPDQIAALTAAARCFRQLDNPMKALELLNGRRFASDRAGTAALAERGHIRFALDDYSGARLDLELVLKRRPESVGALCLLSDVLTRLGDFSEAANVSERLIHVDPGHYHAYVVLGRARFKSGETQKGVDALRQLLPLEDSPQMRWAAEVALEARQLDLAQALVSRSIALRPHDPDTWLLRLDVLKAQSSHRPLPDELTEFLSGFEREDLLSQRENVVKGIAAALTISVEHFGPKHVVAALSVLRRFVSEVSEDGLLGQVLAGFLACGLRQLKAPWEEWRSTLNTLRAEVGSLASCQIPLAFLEAALGFNETRDQRHLLQLPLELRQLLEEELLNTSKSIH